MGLAYAGAHYNIAASWAADGSGDCFANRDLSIMAYTTVTLSREHGEIVEYTFSRSFAGYPTMVDVPLTTRVWVVQEQYQLKRQLSFLHRICWQCSELSASEYYPTGSMDDPFLEMRLSTYEKPTIDINNYYDFQQTWIHLVHSYMACHLIQRPDKLIALAGLAGEMRKRI
ncbi:hypothetical protein K445DRAFT_26777 [Daldinia sp. EC12]|nr:hypothetical protein K445DRAFT_26777 [Daldinia sp. EC12]